MNPKIPESVSDPQQLADTLIERLNRNIVLALPLGLGKANHLANALFDRASADAGISLTIFTAITLEPPHPSHELSKRFLEPVAERFFAGYPALKYAQAMHRNELPTNIRVHEFFLAPGQWLNQPEAQQAYRSANYTHVLDLLIEAKVNLIAQLVAPAPAPEEPLSLSCNPDITVDLFNARDQRRIDFLAVAQINPKLPYMRGEALRAPADFDYLLDDPTLAFPLFAPPLQPVSLADQAIGLHVARLVADGGTLQIGIGSISDAVCHALVLRQQHNQDFRALLNRLGTSEDSQFAEMEPFAEGLYGLSEMLVEGFLALIDADILKREVNGICLHAGFFLGSPRFYERLRNLPDDLSRRIAMMPISFVNALYPDPESKRQARRHGRFVNSAMMVTASGAVVSDGLDDGQVVSGVGGQYNFAAMAFDLPEARSIITLRSTRRSKGQTLSNLVWNYGHCTLPRHLRDIVVTEYGIADLRGKSDSEVIARLLAITDSRFQDELIARAKAAGKLAQDYRLPEACRLNTPQALIEKLGPARDTGQLPYFPLGSDFSAEEERLTAALSQIAERKGARRALAKLALAGLKVSPTAETDACLARMKLAHPTGLREHIYRALVQAALSRPY